MILFKVKGQTNIYGNLNRFIHVLNTVFKDEDVEVEVLQVSKPLKTTKAEFLQMQNSKGDNVS